jgi:hypothetical protein
MSSASSTASLPAPESACARCGARFHCGRDDTTPCWCAALPPLDPTRYDAHSGCLCEACLQATLGRPRAAGRVR